MTRKCAQCGGDMPASKRKNALTCSLECQTERSRIQSKEGAREWRKEHNKTAIVFLNEPCPFLDGRLPREVTKNACWL